jgi:hypothetical protein
MWVGPVVEVGVAEGVELDPQAASTIAAMAIAVPASASLLRLRFGDMVLPDLLGSTAPSLAGCDSRQTPTVARGEESAGLNVPHL